MSYSAWCWFGAVVVDGWMLFRCKLGPGAAFICMITASSLILFVSPFVCFSFLTITFILPVWAGDWLYLSWFCVHS